MVTLEIVKDPSSAWIHTRHSFGEYHLSAEIFADEALQDPTSLTDLDASLLIRVERSGGNLFANEAVRSFLSLI